MGQHQSLEELKREPRFKFNDPPVVGNKVAVNPYKGPKIDFYKVFEGKDDEALLTRAYYVVKWTSFVAAIFTAGECVLGENTTALNVTRKALYHGIPWVGGGLIYVSTCAAASSLRKKHDNYNHAIAGYMTGAFLATRCRPGSSRWVTAIVSGTILAFVGGLYREMDEMGMSMFPNVDEMRVPEISSWYGHRWDGHRTRDGGYNWVAAPKEESTDSQTGKC